MRTNRSAIDWMAVLGAGFGAALLPGKALAQRPLGIDVSSYQHTITWSSVKGDGVVFAWAKATEGTSIIDAYFTANENNGKSAGVYMGAYHFAHPNDASPGTEENYFWNEAGGYIKADGKTLMPMLDMEVFSGVVGASSYSDWANDWCTDAVADAAANGVHIKPAIYVSACNACDFNTSVAQWYSDIADYNGDNLYTGNPWTVCTSCEKWGSGVWSFWQVSSSGAISGISGNVDLDTFNGTTATLASTMLATAANTPIYYWDPQAAASANPYTGSMSGTWENAKWSSSGSGQSSTVNWVDGKAACFGVNTGKGTPAFTVTMNQSHVVAGIFNGALSPNACDVTLSGSGTINLATGAQGIDAYDASDNSSAYIRINVPIAGNGQAVAEGSGQIYFNTANTYSGGTQLGYSGNSFSGILNFNNGDAFGTGTILLTTDGSGGALAATGTAAMTVPNDFQLNAATTNNFVGTTGGVTYSGNWSMGSHRLTFETGSTAGKIDNVAGVMSGTAGLTVTDAGTLILSGVNTYSGSTTISSPAMFTIGGAGQLGSGSYAGAISVGGTFNYSSSASQTLSGVVSGAGAMAASSGSLVFTGVNTHTGPFAVSGGGIVAINADSGLGATNSAVTLNGGCLKNNNSAPTLSASRTITLGANGGYFDAGWGPSEPISVNSKLTGSGSLLVNRDGSPVILVNTGNNYTGDTVAGTNGPGYYGSGTVAWLKLGASGVIPNGSGKGNVILHEDYNGVLDLAGFSQTINGLIGDGTVDNSAGNGSLTVGNNNATSAFNGVIKDSAGTLTLTKIGSGTLTLGGSNTYSGNTAINAGSLALDSGGSITTTPKITIAAGATFDVSAIASFGLSPTTSLSAAGTTAPATILGGTTVNLGSQPIVLTYDGLHPALTVAQGALVLNGNPITVNGTQLPVGAYTLIQQTSGTVSATGNFAVAGTAIGAPGTTAWISVSGGSVILNIGLTTATALNPLTPSTYGQPVTFTASATPAPTTGFMQFFDNSVALGGPVSLTSGSASYTTNALAVGNHPITATFSGTAGYAPSSTSNSSIQQVTLPTNSTPVTITSAKVGGNGSLQMSFSGLPGYTYLIQAASSLNPPILWTNVSTNVADINGLFYFSDTTTNFDGHYYRTAVQQ